MEIDELMLSKSRRELSCWRSPSMNSDELRSLLEKLTGQSLPIPDVTSLLGQVAFAISSGQSIGYSQFNELLLNVGYDRVDSSFFGFLCDPVAVSIGGDGSQEIASAAALEKGVARFRELALLLYGNVKYGFKTLAADGEQLKFFVQQRRERSDRDFRSRHDPLLPLKRISGEDTYLLGYISGREIDKGLEKSPDDSFLLKRKAHRDTVVEQGRWNHNVYLTFDHLDVYVATSMRERHEYVFVSEFMTRIEANAHLKDLKLRIFDPTLAFCADRVDKGLAEALMLKRAACTIYLAQESDTLGKDSELASTLAQGKPVIAFVPAMSEDFWNFLYKTFRGIESEQTEQECLIRILQIYDVQAAWTKPAVQEHLTGKQPLELAALVQMAREAVTQHYDKRANVLKDAHPLGLQTNLNTGVANGVLVVRSIDHCAELVKRILLNKMEFEVEDTSEGYAMLREKISGCVFRVMTADRLLTNSFWNFYNVN
jgi:hypothetical protein